jgi:hypothetical protein
MKERPSDLRGRNSNATFNTPLVVCTEEEKEKNHDSKVKFTSHLNAQGFVSVSVRMRESPDETRCQVFFPAASSGSFQGRQGITPK